MNFSFKAVTHNKHRENVSSIIEKSISGKVIEECIDDTFSYFVLVGDKKYSISEDSFITRKKKCVYYKEKNGKWACVIRMLKEDRVSMPSAYLPFRPDYEVIGDIVNNKGKFVFNIKGCYKPNSNEKVIILKEIENEECQS